MSQTSGRGSTRTGQPSALPTGSYTPPPPVTHTAKGLAVPFAGEDGRARIFDVSSLTMPQWHEALAASWANRLGPVGPLRTGASSDSAWAAISRIMLFLNFASRRPGRPEDLRPFHVDAYRRDRERTSTPRSASLEIRSIALTFATPPLGDLIPRETLDRMRTRTPSQSTPLPGYSDRELERLVAAARTDVAELRDRLDGGDAGNHGNAFITQRDLVPMLVLLCAMTGWNVETLKELPVKYRLLDDRAVEVEVIKRRRGAGRWHNTATWEIGPPHRALHTPGGVYLLLHRLMAPARARLPEPSFWAIKRFYGADAEQGWANPFGANLGGNLKGTTWARDRGLRFDPPPSSPGDEGAPFRLNFNRLKTSIDVRRTRQMGGHLPSSARTNTVPVLFSNYLAGDPTTIEWAHDVVAEALVEVEQVALDAHRRALAATGGTTLRVLTADDPPCTDAVASADDAQDVDDDMEPQPATDATHPQEAVPAAGGALDTAWSACVDHDHHPLTGRRCGVSFLDCFSCSNALVTGAHLPRLLGLLDALDDRRHRMPMADWWTRYGPTWAAIRHEVLPKFSEAEVAAAEQAKSPDVLLDRVEPPWERP